MSKECTWSFRWPTDLPRSAAARLWPPGANAAAITTGHTTRRPGASVQAFPPQREPCLRPGPPGRNILRMVGPGGGGSAGVLRLRRGDTGLPGIFGKDKRGPGVVLGPGGIHRRRSLGCRRRDIAGGGMAGRPLRGEAFDSGRRPALRRWIRHSGFRKLLLGHRGDLCGCRFGGSGSRDFSQPDDGGQPMV